MKANKKESNWAREVRQMTPEAARAWCHVLRLEWMTFDVSKVKGRSYAELLQIRANDDA